MMLTIIFPVLNERLRLEKGITRTVEYLDKIGFSDYEILIVDNGSEDETPQIADKLCRRYSRVKYEKIPVRGVGAAFRRGVKLSHGDIVGYMDIDLSTNIKHLGEAIEIFKERPEIEYINGSRFAKASDTRGRKWYRKITSQGLLILLKVFLGMKSTDAICGFTFVRKKTAVSLIKGCSRDNGWFYMIEFLLRAEKRGVRILDYPVEWEEDYNTTVKLFRTIFNYLKQIARLFWEFNIRKNI
ncbi:MAG TPA: glycosyltransferase [Candidatus Acetatifactor stercoripullorum]|uniref:Glycosyltransferase n=1 Tax=Candidatus Acetatifactor stercoripullorum TaxID=2838414 RepID=A0A9D1R8I6_9FIRM|nr:glycosyltransferase [uncultured Acetatifactor sp.]HIW82478.1 glycosyltransferase [Candidatus Acetatifactor stercoripullorum]